MISFLGFLAFLVCIYLGYEPFIKAARHLFEGQARVTVAYSLPKVIMLTVLGVFVWYMFASIIIIQAGDRAVIFNAFNGVQNKVLNEGMHIVPRLVNSVSHYDVYTKTWSDIIPCLSSDGLQMTMDVSIRYRINALKVADIKRRVGEDEDILNKILIPTARSKMRDVTTTFTAQEGYASKRMQLQERYRELLEEFFKGEDYIIAEQILVRQVTPPQAVTDKITETKVAEQDVVKQKNILEAQKMIKEQTIVKAQAEAEALRIKGNAIAQSPKIIQLEWIKVWDGHLPQIMTGSGSNLLLNVGDINKTAKE